MKLDFISLLPIQRELYRLPRGLDRFRAYLRAMIDWDKEEMKLPLHMMNPMGKEHVPEFIDALLAFDAEAIAAQACRDAERQLKAIGGTWRVGLVAADDLAGGWTNRYASEFTHRFQSEGLYRSGWVIGYLWTSDLPPSARLVREEVLSSIYRLAHVERHGIARTLRDRLAQEGFALSRAGCTAPTLDADDLDYTRQVIAPLLDASDMRCIECLFGDAAGGTLGFAPQGLSACAGLALALHEAQPQPVD